MNSWININSNTMIHEIHHEIYKGSVLPDFFPGSRVNDVKFVTFFCDKKCDASHLSHFWEECDALTHEFFVEFVTFFVTSFPNNSTFWPCYYNTFWTGKNVTIRTETCFSLPVSELSLISEVWNRKAIWAQTDSKNKIQQIRQKRDSIAAPGVWYPFMLRVFGFFGLIMPPHR